MPVLLLTSQFTNNLRYPDKGAGPVEYWDAKVSGLCLRVFGSGRATWSFRYRPKGGHSYERITLGNLSDLTLADARGRATRLRVEVADGGDPQMTRRQKRHAALDTLTFDRLADRYIDEYAKPNKASWKNDELYLKRPREKWKKKAAAEVTRRDVITLLDQIKADAPVSANRIQTTLSGMFNWAVEGELLSANPIAGMKKRAKETPKERTLKDDEIRVLWAALEAPTGITIDTADALRFLLLTGQRPGEVSGMVKAELTYLDTPREARWEIPAARMKARRPHVVPLTPMASAILKGALARREADGDGESIFASRFFKRATLARHSLSQGLSRIIERLEPSGPDAEAVESLQAAPPTPHDFRRTVGTGLAAFGISREDRKAVLAHVEGDVHGVHYDRYERLKEKRIALETWERHVRSVLAGKKPMADVLPLRRDRQ